MSPITSSFIKMTKTQQVKTLREWDKAYYLYDSPVISDADYDYCVSYFNSKYPDEKYSSSIGESVEGFVKYNHSTPVLSLAKITTIEGYKEYGEKYDYNVVVEPKIDGLTVVYYPDGSLVSRGNGYIGEVLPNARDIPGMPKPLSLPVRMEVCIDKEAYLLMQGATKKAPRNVAAGILRRKDKTVNTRYLSFYAYNILGSELSEEKQLMLLKANGFRTVDYVKLSNKEDYIEYFSKLNQLASVCLAPTDGIVIKCNLPEKAATMGMTAHHPNNMVAFKFESQIAETTLIDIEWSRGRNLFTPVAVFNAVVLGGNIIRRASLHNLNIMGKLGIKHKGCTVVVTLKNEIIPQIIMARENDNSTEPIIIPHNCPYCGKELIINESQQLICPNDRCSYTYINDLKRFVSKEALDIAGISDVLAERAAERIKDKNNFVHPIITLCQSNVAQLAEYFQITNYMATKLYNNVKKAMVNVDPARFIYACNIPGLGINTAKDIMRYYDYSVPKFVNNFKETGMNVDGIGEAVYKSICDNLYKVTMYTIWTIPQFKEVKSTVTTNNDKTLTFAITGKLSKPRKFFTESIEKLGHVFSSGITKKVDYLICGEDAGSKLEKAKGYGINIISEEEFQNKFVKKGDSQND